MNGATADSRYAGSVSVVVGGSSGIGRAVVERLECLGSTVWVLDTNPSEGRWLGVDVADSTQVDAAFAAIAKSSGRVDYLIHTAAVGSIGTVEDDPLEEWQRVLDINVLGPVRTVRAALPLLRLSPTPAVVTLSSVVADVGIPQRAAYSASKGAVSALVRACAADFVTEGIRFNAVNPGTVDTPWVRRLLDREEQPDQALAALRARQPHGRLVAPSEVVEAVLLLLSPDAGSINGTTLTVDGGLAAIRVPTASSVPTAQEV